LAKISFNLWGIEVRIRGNPLLLDNGTSVVVLRGLSGCNATLEFHVNTVEFEFRANCRDFWSLELVANGGAHSGESTTFGVVFELRLSKTEVSCGSTEANVVHWSYNCVRYAVFVGAHFLSSEIGLYLEGN